MDHSRRHLLIGGASALIAAAMPALLARRQASPPAGVPPQSRRVSVRQFGAAGDGRTDDTAAINRALGACAGGDTLYFPAGRYLVSVSDGRERSVAAIPVGVHVLMESDAWILPAVAAHTISVFMPLGSNILQVNVDGRSLPDQASVDQGSWANRAHGVRAYAAGDYGAGASDVTIVNSRFRNLRYGIETEGARRWRIANCDFERIMQSGVLIGYRDGRDTFDITVENNRFTQLGDTAVALYHIEGNRSGRGERLRILGNRALDYCLRTAGFAFDVEEGDASLQRDILMAGNIAEHRRTGLPHAVGGFVMGGVTNGEMRGNVAIGAGNSNADMGFNMLGCRDSRIVGNRAENWRGAGINTDGSERVDVAENEVTDCGGTNMNAPSIRISYAFSTRDITVRRNRVRIRPGYRFVGAGALAIGAITPLGGTVQDIRIVDNELISPLDVGIGVYGTDASPVRNFAVDHNRIVGEGAGLFGSFAVHVARAIGGSVAGNIVQNARFGIAVQYARQVTVEQNQFAGTQAMEVGFELGRSTDLTVRGNRSSTPLRVVFGSSGPGIHYEGNVLPGRRPAPIATACRSAGIGSKCRAGRLRALCGRRVAARTTERGDNLPGGRFRREQAFGQIAASRPSRLVDHAALHHAERERRKLTAVTLGRRQADLRLGDQRREVISRVDGSEHRQPGMHVGNELARNVVGAVPRIEHDQADMALRIEAGHFVRFDLVEEQYVRQAPAPRLRTQSRHLAASPNQQEADRFVGLQGVGQVDQPAGVLGDPHIACVDEDLAPGERGGGDVDRAAAIGGGRHPILEHFDPRLRPAPPAVEKYQVARTLHADRVGLRILEIRDGLEEAIGQPATHDAGVHGPFREEVPHDQIGGAEVARFERARHRAEKDRWRVPDHAVEAPVGERGCPKVAQHRERHEALRDSPNDMLAVLGSGRAEPHDLDAVILFDRPARRLVARRDQDGDPMALPDQFAGEVAQLHRAGRARRRIGVGDEGEIHAVRPDIASTRPCSHSRCS